MGRYIVKFKDHYFEWSTIVDAPVSYAMDRETFEIYYRWRYGENGMRDLPERMERADKFGSSAIPPQSAENIMDFNRYGDNEKRLSIDEVWRKLKSESEATDEEL